MPTNSPRDFVSIPRRSSWEDGHTIELFSRWLAAPAVPSTDSDSNRITHLCLYVTHQNTPDYMTTDDPTTGAATGTYRFFTDVRGSVRLVVNVDTGDVTQRATYDPFGR